MRPVLLKILGFIVAGLAAGSLVLGYRLFGNAHVWLGEIVPPSTKFGDDAWWIDLISGGFIAYVPGVFLIALGLWLTIVSVAIFRFRKSRQAPEGWNSQ